MKNFLLMLLAVPALQVGRVQAQASTGGQPATGPVVQHIVGPSAIGPAVLREGKVIYERKVNLHRRLTDESMKSMVPEFNTSKAELDFSSDESIYKNIKEEEDIRDKAGQENNGIVMKFNGGGADDQTYKNYATEKTTQQRELGPKKYLIEDSLKKQTWKMEEGTKTIRGYVCKKATTKSRDGKDIIAWYAEDIQTSTGPEIFGGLPGLILELNINDAEIVFSALDIVTKDFDKAIVKAPVNGKKISRKEFDQMMEEQYGVKPGGSGTTIRIIRN